MGGIAFDRSHGGAGGPLIDFSVSINPFGPPPAVLDTYHRAAAAIGSYPEPYAATLTAAIAASLGVAPGNVLAGNGSTQLIYLIARVLRPRRPVVVIPAFSEFANSLLTQPPAAAPVPLLLRRESHFELEIDALDAALAGGADALFLGRPNSPTAASISLAQTASIARRCAARRCWLVIDEAFIEFAEEPASATALVEHNDWLIVLRSMTKLYAIPGLRLGYLVAGHRAVAELARAHEPWSVSGPAAAVGMACLAQPDSWREENRLALRRECGYLMEQLGAIAGFEVFPSTANFLMFEVRAAPRPFAEHMRAYGIVVRDLAALPGAGPDLYRIGARSRTDNDLLLEAARRYC
jgi:threonine-phosphate decarboxylase